MGKPTCQDFGDNFEFEIGHSNGPKLFHSVIIFGFGQEDNGIRIEVWKDPS